jgi:hypothetical protein
MYNFGTQESFASESTWIGDLASGRVEPLDLVAERTWSARGPFPSERINPLQADVKSHGRRADHVGAEPSDSRPGHASAHVGSLTRCVPSVCRGSRWT